MIATNLSDLETERNRVRKIKQEMDAFYEY
jgi:hypothetical protein